MYMYIPLVESKTRQTERRTDGRYTKTITEYDYHKHIQDHTKRQHYHTRDYLNLVGLRREQSQRFVPKVEALLHLPGGVSALQHHGREQPQAGGHQLHGAGGDKGGVQRTHVLTQDGSCQLDTRGGSHSSTGMRLI